MKDHISSLESPSSVRKTILSSGRTQGISLRDRVCSIKADAEYVLGTARKLGNPPIVANVRCGSWYVPPENLTGSVYFKSTDGHRNNWAFNTRRLNLSLLEILGRDGLCIIVDSAKNKYISDGLSKTVPIWCVVMNRLLFPDREEHHELKVDESYVSAAEQIGIRARLCRFVETAQSLPLDIRALRRTLRKPMITHFCTHSGASLNPRELSTDANHIICLSASANKESSLEDENFTYIPGAGDDDENWAHGLTPEILWKYGDGWTEEDEAKFSLQVENAIINSKASLTGSSDPIQSLKPIKLGPLAPEFIIGTYAMLDPLKLEGFGLDAAIVCREADFASGPQDSTISAADAYLVSRSLRKIPVLNLTCRSGKLGSRALRTEFVKVAPFLCSRFAIGSQPRLLFASSTGRDLAIGVSLMVACKHIDKSGLFQPNGVKMNDVGAKDMKMAIRKKLVQILTQMGINDHGVADGRGIQRATLNSVNSFVIELPERNMALDD